MRRRLPSSLYPNKWIKLYPLIISIIHVLVAVESSLHTRFSLLFRIRLQMLILLLLLLLLLCSFDSYESSDIIWDTSKCVTEHLLNNVTRCICPISGTYVVLLEQQKLLVSSTYLLRPPPTWRKMRKGEPRNIFVVVVDEETEIQRGNGSAIGFHFVVSV